LNYFKATIQSIVIGQDFSPQVKPYNFYPGLDWILFERRFCSCIRSTDSYWRICNACRNYLNHCHCPTRGRQFCSMHLPLL